MKKIFTISVLAFSMMLSAQEAGKVGELLKNEADRSEMQIQKREAIGSSSRMSSNSTHKRPSNSNNNTSTDRGVNTRIRNNQGYQNNNYRWHQNYGYSEVFLRIPEYGYFAVEIGDQMIANGSGKYRFFDLEAGRTPISIYEDGYLIYRTRVNLQNNRRLVLDFFSNKGLYLLDSYPIQSQTYGFNEWDDVWNNPYGNGGNYGNYGNSNANNGYYGNVMNNGMFNSLMKNIEKTSFDKDKIAMLQQVLKNGMMTSQQIRTVLQTFSFDSYRLDAAKKAYHSCADPVNYFVVNDTFDFDSNKRKLMEYINRN